MKIIIIENELYLAQSISSKLQENGYTVEVFSSITEAMSSNVDVYLLSTNLPGLLFIDTPGHHSFSTLRSRGGALADIAVLVVDITEGFKPQTIESINILKQHKTPFILALNKVDKLPGWTTKTGSFLANRANQSQNAQQTFQTRLYEIIGELGIHGFDSALFTEIQDFQSANDRKHNTTYPTS